MRQGDIQGQSLQAIHDFHGIFRADLREVAQPGIVLFFIPKQVKQRPGRVKTGGGRALRRDYTSGKSLGGVAYFRVINF